MTPGKAAVSNGLPPVSYLDAHTIQKFYNSLIGLGLSSKTVKNIHGVLHSALQQAIANGYIRNNPTEACASCPKLLSRK